MFKGFVNFSIIELILFYIIFIIVFNVILIVFAQRRNQSSQKETLNLIKLLPIYMDYYIVIPNSLPIIRLCF